jgi:REP element-mobilizing transposase RayT
MARPLRVHAPGVAAHVVSRGDDKRPIFLDTVDYEKYLVLLEGGLRRFDVKCHMFCLLWNHLHLVITPSVFPIWRLMHQVNSTYCEWFNARHHRVGHVLQGRYGCRLADESSYFLNAIRYVALNPVAAGKVRRAEDWPWGSYRALLGLAAMPAFLDTTALCRSLDAESEADLRVRLKTFVEAGDAADGWRSLINGSEAFVKRMDGLIQPQRRESDYSYADRYATRPDLATLIEGLEGDALDVAVTEAFLKHGYTLRAIGDTLGEKHPSTIWRWIQRTLAKAGR